MSTDIQLARQAREASFGPLAVSNARQTARNQDTFTLNFRSPVDASAAYAAQFKLAVLNQPVVVQSIRFWSESSIASGVGLVATVLQDNDAGSGSTNVSTAAGITTSSTQSLAAGQSVTMPLNATVANLSVPSGNSIYLNIAKVSSGVTGGPWGCSITLMTDGPGPNG